MNYKNLLNPTELIPEEQDQFIKRMIEEEPFRRATTSASLFWFMRCYLPRHNWIGTADFQKEIIGLLAEDIPGITAIAAFREAGKSSLLRAFITHQIVTGKKHFILIAGKTEQRAQDYLKSIKREFEDKSNILLQNDLGPFYDESDEWGKSIVVPKYDARIMAVSVEQSVRGVHYRQYRPDLVILDDIEDLMSVKTKEATDKIQEWLERDVIPASTRDARIIIVSNLLTEDSVLTRLRKQIESGERDGVFRMYPLVDAEGKVAWPEKFPTPESLEIEKRRHTELAWKQEFLLLPVTSTEPVIKREWLKFYNNPPTDLEHRYRLISIDPAFSERAQADNTAIVCADIYGYGDKRRIYIRRKPINERGLTAKNIIDYAKHFYNEATNIKRRANIVIETVGAQSVYPELFRDADLRNIYEFVPGRKDKRERLSLAGYEVEHSRVWFPADEEDGELLDQLLRFGSCVHDDLADAFSMLILKVVEIKECRPMLKRVDDCSEQKLMTPQEQAELAYRQEQEAERQRFNDSMGDALRRYEGY